MNPGDIFLEGYDVFMSGNISACNPYPAGSHEAGYWRMGFYEARHKIEMMVQEEPSDETA